jgi:mannose-6-phosphate isomerase-like protein (cupin superfamily)
MPHVDANPGGLRHITAADAPAVATAIRQFHYSDAMPITRLSLTLAMLLSLSAAVAAQAPAGPTPTDRTKATHFSAADLQAALAKLPTDRPASSVRVFSLTPYNVNVERRLPQAQGASLHEAQAELFYVIDGTATMLTGGKMVDPTRNGTNLSAKAIDGGVRQVLNKGDFFIVPSGVPHQFVDLTGPVQVMAIYLPNTP